MSVTNFVEVQGTVKNIKTFTGSRGTLVTGWFTQRITNPIDITVLNVGIVAKKPQIANELAKLGEGVHGITIIGRLLTNVIKKDNKDDEYRIQIEVDEFSVSE